MTIDIKEMSEKDLKQKIENIKAEREKTADALKKYEEELERRKKEVPLGVPLEDKTLYQFFASYGFYFESKESERVFNGRIKDYVKALIKLSKGEPIDVQVLLPLLPKGWVAMDKNGYWYWFENKPVQEELRWIPAKIPTYSGLWSMRIFNLKPHCNWEESLMECGL